MTIQVGILGCGNHAKNHAKTVSDNPLTNLIACADIRIDQALRFAETFSIPHSYSSLKEMVESHSLDLLIIVAFPTVHPQLIREAIELGIRAILCEKPLALVADQVREIQSMVERTGTLIVEGLMYRSHPQFHKAKELVENGAIGDVRYIHAQFTDYKNSNPDNWRNDPKLGGGSMTAKGCYLVDACNVFSGSRAEAAFCIETNDPEYNHVEIGESGTIVYNNGVMAHFETNHRSVWREEIKLCGTLGTLIIPHAVVTKSQTRRIQLQLDGAYENRPMQIETFEFDVHSSYALQLDNIYHCIRNGAKPNLSLDDSLANYRVTDALMRSVKTGKLEQVHWGDMQ